MNFCNPTEVNGVSIIIGLFCVSDRLAGATVTFCIQTEVFLTIIK